MDRLLTPVERFQFFRPPFCPRRDCPEHTRRGPGYRFRRHGSYRRRGSPVPRFLCLACRRTFSRQAFSTAYYLKRPELLRPVAAGLVAGAAHRQIARTLGCAPSTVTRLAARIGRHCLLLHLHALDSLPVGLSEPIVLDHFETFEFSQDLPFGVATAVGQRSWFVYGLDPAPHRRAGRVSPAQRRRLSARPRRRMRGGYRGSTTRTLDRLLALGPGPLRLVADDHPSYRAVVAAHPARSRIRLETHRNPVRGPKGSPRSAEARARDQALFAVDLLHLLIRHSQAAHRRETIAFGRRLNAVTERLFVLAVWRNFVKSRSERHPDGTTPATRLGLTDRAWTWENVLARRRFPDRENLRAVDRVLYDRAWITPVLTSNTRHARALAY